MVGSSAWQPRVELGVNHTLCFEEDVDREREVVLGRGSLELDAYFDLAAQVRINYALGDNMFLNASVRWIDIDTEADFEFPANPLEADVEIDLLVYFPSMG